MGGRRTKEKVGKFLVKHAFERAKNRLANKYSKYPHRANMVELVALAET